MNTSGVAICGTRGWFYEEDSGAGEHDEKVFKRELLRLEASLKAAGDMRKLVFLHYPPRYRGYECPEILQLLDTIRRTAAAFTAICTAEVTPLPWKDCGTGWISGWSRRIIPVSRPYKVHARNSANYSKTFFIKSVDISLLFLIEYIG